MAMKVKAVEKLLKFRIKKNRLLTYRKSAACFFYILVLIYTTKSVVRVQG